MLHTRFFSPGESETYLGNLGNEENAKNVSSAQNGQQEGRLLARAPHVTRKRYLQEVTSTVIRETIYEFDRATVLNEDVA